MKKISIAVLAVTVLVVCLFAGCNGADGGKITDTQQDLSEAMTGMQDMMTGVSEDFTVTSDGNITENSSVTAPSVSATADNVTM